MEKERNIDLDNDRHELDPTGLDDDGMSNTLPLVNGMHVDRSRPYRRSRKFSRYNNALKNLIPIRRNEKSTEYMPIDSAGLYSTVFGGWLTKYLWKAYVDDGTNMSDLPGVSPYDCCDYNAQRLEILWNDEVSKNGTEKASFGKVAWRFVRTRTLVSCTLLSVTLILGFLSPVLLMRKVLEFVESPESAEDKLGEGIKWALLLGLCEFTRILFLNWSWVINYRTALRLKNAYLGMLYKKVIKTNGFGNESSGKLINMMSNDGQRFYEVCLYGPPLVGGPMVAVFGIVYVLWILSPMGLFGVLTFFLFYPVQYGISRLTGYFKSKGVKITDQRISGINEILDCVKLIKMYAWEEPFRLNLLEIRRKEQNWLHKISYVRSIGMSMSPMIPVISVIVTLLAHVAGGNNLTAAQAFPITMFFMNQMKQAISGLREGTRFYVDCQIAFRRFKSILVTKSEQLPIQKPILKNQALSIINATFTCEIAEESSLKRSNSTPRNSNDENDPENDPTNTELTEILLPSPRSRIILTEITFQATKGNLIGICGHVGSGKTSLLLAALGQLRLLSGKITRDGRCAYVSQQAWILHATVRQNIIFGENYDEKRYNATIELCRLREDLEAFAAADDTEIGERGINLSGGQKQRVALARAFYADRDIYFLDDPLSAVDAQVGAYIFDNLIRGALTGKTILFVTHQIQYLNRCDEIFMMSGGRIVEHGVHEKLMEANNKYATMVNSMISESDRESSQNRKNVGKNERIDEKIVSPSGWKDPRSPGAVDDVTNEKKDVPKEGASIMVPDNVETGTIKTQTYLTYVRATGGYIVALSVFLIFILNVGSTAFSTWWLAHWIKAGGGEITETMRNETSLSRSIIDNPDLKYYEIVYGTCIAVILITSALRGLAIARATIRASTSLHNSVLTKIIRAPMEFFETTPRGRIQNIFSRDTDEIDVSLPISLEHVLQSSLGCIISLGFICAVFPSFIVALIILGFAFYYIGRIFRIALRDYRRFESTTRSPIFSFATASVQGLDTIHAFKKENQFIKQFQTYLDANGAYQYLCNIAMRWLAIRYDALAGVATATTGLLVVFLKGQVPPALAGLAMSYSGQMSGIFQFTMRMFYETELRFISIERMNYYLKTLVNEDDGTKPTKKCLEDWPRNGQIEFENVELRYRKDLPTVLNRISFHIRTNEKIGIVGRTGSGKSSIITALFRIVELTGGSIKIDDTDISEIPMKILRANISIIPQDPVLFNRSVRFNLDPNGEKSDAELWLVLEKTQLKNKVRGMTGQLGATIENGGSNLSMGERQLLCLARALLRTNKILVLDEATAAVDPETEAIVQMTIQREFDNCTVMTIAHRLQTVLSCDRILVMDAGNVVEFDTPNNLLMENSNTRFSKMMNAANEAMIGFHH